MAAEWINRRKLREEQEKQDAEFDAAKNRLAEQAIKADGPVYWDLLLPKLSEQCNDMDELGYQAKAYAIENQLCPEEKNYRIEIQSKGHWPIDARASLIYFIGSDVIRVSSDIRKLSEISLCATEHGIRGVSNLEIKRMGAEELASYLLEGLVESIEKEKRSQK